MRFDYKDEASIHRYLKNLYTSIVNRDIVGKSKSADRKNFMDISLYLLANAGKELSIDNIIQTFEKDNKTISKRTIYNYLEKMKKAYLIHGVGRYNIVGNRHSAIVRNNMLLILDFGRSILIRLISKIPFSRKYYIQ